MIDCLREIPENVFTNDEKERLVGEMDRVMNGERKNSEL
jgi:hypothetical protein